MIALKALAVFSVAFSMCVPQASAATYFSMSPGDETCVSVYLGAAGRGEYTLRVSDPGELQEKPWADTHFVSLLARPDNIVTVPVCFSAIGRSIGDKATLTMTISTPKGEDRREYGICVSRNEDVDLTGTLVKDPCADMGKHTDIFSAALTEPELYVSPSEKAVFTLLIDSSLEATATISKASGQMQISASQTSVELGSGMKQVNITMDSPSATGDYPFSIMVSLADCSIDDCRREAKGTLHVREKTSTEAEEAGFFLYLTPETQATIGMQAKQYMMKVRNYGVGQKITFAVSVADGAETDFSPYTVFIGKGDEKSVPLTVMPQASGSGSYKISATAYGDDGKSMSAEAWLTAGEMASDAEKQGNDADAAKYESSTEATLNDWISTDAQSQDDTEYDEEDFPDVDTTPQGINIFMIAIAIAVAAGAGGIFLLYMRSRGKNQNDGYAQLEKDLS